MDKMDWNRNGSNGGVDNQQYLPQSTSSAVTAVQSMSIPQNSCPPAGQFIAGNKGFLKNLLGAKSEEEVLKIQQSALGKMCKRASHAQQVSQASSGQYNTLYSPLLETTTNNQSGLNVQKPILSNYRVVHYPNTVPQDSQQPQSVPVMQHYEANGYNAREMQQPVQNSQASVGYVYSHQKVQQPAQNVYSSARRPVNAVQTPHRQLAPKTNSPMYAVQNGSSAPYVTAHKTPTEPSVPVSTPDYRNNHHFQNQNRANYTTLVYGNILQQTPQQLQTMQQQSGNDYAPSPQRQLMQNFQNGFANNSAQLLSTGTCTPTVQRPPSYAQSVSNKSNVNMPINQQFANQSQNYTVQNMQQPLHSVPQDQNSAAAQSQSHAANVALNKKREQELFLLLKVYRDVKQKYLLLNHENNLLRQKLQTTNTSQGNASSCAVQPQLISTLQNVSVPTNDTLAGQQKMPHAAPGQNPPPLNAAHTFQGQIVYANIPAQNNPQTSQSFPDQRGFSNQVSTSDKRDLINRNSYSVFDGGQMNIGSNASSIRQTLGSGSLMAKDHQKVAARASMVPTNGNQYISSGNPSNEHVSQNGLHVNPLHSLVQTTPLTSESLAPIPPPNTSNEYSSYYAGMLNSNGHFVSGSREAIEAALPLWKSVPKGSTLNRGGPSETEHRQPLVDSKRDAFSLLEEITFGSTNEATSVAPAQKPESSAPNASKGVELQIAIVSPLVQSKERVLEEQQQLPKVNLKVPDIENQGIASLFNENDCFIKLIQALQSVNTVHLNNVDISKPKEQPPSRTSGPHNVASSLLSNKLSSQNDVGRNSTGDIEISENLQISGVCTLVEGNSLYDSSIARMFDNSLQTEVRTAFTKTSSADGHGLQQSLQTINTSCTSQATANSTSPDTDIEAIKPENEKAELSLVSEENLHGAQCFEIQPDRSLMSTSETFCELESSSVSDQLSELLTEFPFGIKNYMPENKLESSDGSVGKLAVKTELQNASTPSKDFQSAGGDKTSHDLQAIVKRVPTPTKDIQSNTEGTSRSPMNDGFDIICDSPEGNIHITLLDQDEMTKLFPEESEKLTLKCEKMKVECHEEATCSKESKEPVLDELNSLKKENSNVNEATAPPYKDLFCCLFSWLTHTNGNAPKCNCKLTELRKAEQSSVNSSPGSTSIKTESSENLPGNSNSCKTERAVLKYHGILPPINKLPKREPPGCSSESSPSLQNHHCSPPEETILNPASSENQGLKGDEKKNKTLTHEKIFHSSRESGEPTSKKRKDGFSSKKSKSDAIPKSEKLIVKTDFLKNKHLQKEKRKDKERETSQVPVSDTGEKIQKAFHKSPGGDDGKHPNVEKMIVKKPISEKVKQPSYSPQQTDRSMKKPKSSFIVDKSTHSRAEHKHRKRAKSQPESHFEKTRKVPTVQEYLERKRELCNKMEPKLERRDDPAKVRHTLAEKVSRGKRQLPNLKRPLSPAKTNVSSKTRKSETSKDVNRTPRDRPRSGGLYETGHKQKHGKGAVVNQGHDLKRSSSKNKIYLSPCIGSRRPSYDGISLTKLQIRCSPEHLARRNSLDSSRSKPSKSETKKTDTPKMLEFKLCPEFVTSSPSTHEISGEPKTSKEKSVVEGIKSKKEAWCSGIPFKKRKVESLENQGSHTPSITTGSTPTYTPIEKNTTRPAQDSQTTFNVFKQMYHEQRSKSLDNSL